MLDAGYDLVGPVTNAPGTEKLQDVRRYLKGYKPTDNYADLQNISGLLAQDYMGTVIQGPLNGFCMMVRMLTWWRTPTMRSTSSSPATMLTLAGTRTLHLS